MLVSADFMIEVLRGHDALTAVSSDMPADIKIVGCGWDETRNCVRLAVESSTFDEVPDGYFAPDYTPAYRQTIMDPFAAAMTLLGIGDS